MYQYMYEYVYIHVHVHLYMYKDDYIVWWISFIPFSFRYTRTCTLSLSLSISILTYFRFTTIIHNYMYNIIHDCTCTCIYMYVTYIYHVIYTYTRVSFSFLLKGGKWNDKDWGASTVYTCTCTCTMCILSKGVDQSQGGICHLLDPPWKKPVYIHVHVSTSQHQAIYTCICILYVHRVKGTLTKNALNLFKKHPSCFFLLPLCTVNSDVGVKLHVLVANTLKNVVRKSGGRNWILHIAHHNTQWCKSLSAISFSF